MEMHEITIRISEETYGQLRFLVKNRQGLMRFKPKGPFIKKRFDSEEALAEYIIRYGTNKMMDAEFLRSCSTDDYWY